MGSAGNFIKNIPFFGNDLVVLHGDLVIDFDFKEASRQFLTSNADFLQLVHPTNHPYDSDLIAIENGIITGVFQKPHEPDLTTRNMANAGIYFFRHSALRKIHNFFTIYSLYIQYIHYIFILYVLYIHYIYLTIIVTNISFKSGSIKKR